MAHVLMDFYICIVKPNEIDDSKKVPCYTSLPFSPSSIKKLEAWNRKFAKKLETLPPKMEFLIKKRLYVLDPICHPRI